MLKAYHKFKQWNMLLKEATRFPNSSEALHYKS